MADYSARVTLTNANQNYVLLTLLRALPRADWPSCCQELKLQSDPDNADDILRGDETLSSTQFGMKLGIGDTDVQRSETNGISLAQINVRSATAGQILNVVANVL